MSIAAMSHVWESSKQTDGALLCLLAIADFANDRWLAWPSIGTLARKSRLSERHVQRVIKDLETSGEIKVHLKSGPCGVNIYEVTRKRGGDILSSGQGDIQMLQMSPCPDDIHDISMSPKPSYNHQGKNRKEPVPPTSLTLTDEFLLEWSKTNLPKPRAITDDRKRKLATRMQEEFFRENWRDGIKRIAGSSFCNGQNERHWQADVDWYLRPGTLAKILEGKYDDRGTAPNGVHSVFTQRPRNPVEAFA